MTFRFRNIMIILGNILCWILPGWNNGDGWILRMSCEASREILNWRWRRRNTLFWRFFQEKAWNSGVNVRRWDNRRGSSYCLFVLDISWRGYEIRWIKFSKTYILLVHVPLILTSTVEQIRISRLKWRFYLPIRANIRQHNFFGLFFILIRQEWAILFNL